MSKKNNDLVNTFYEAMAKMQDSLDMLYAIRHELEDRIRDERK